MECSSDACMTLAVYVYDSSDGGITSTVYVYEWKTVLSNVNKKHLKGKPSVPAAFARYLNKVPWGARTIKLFTIVIHPVALLDLLIHQCSSSSVLVYYYSVELGCCIRV